MRRGASPPVTNDPSVATLLGPIVLAAAVESERSGGAGGRSPVRPFVYLREDSPLDGPGSNRANEASGVGRAECRDAF